MRSKSFRVLSLAVAVGLGTLAATAETGDARAQTDFLTDLLMPEQQEKAVAEQEHPKILAQFGGEYRDPELHRYVQSIADFLGHASNRPDIKYKVTILNSPVVNAFALPAGYLYITRGLLALADNEAELAGVLAHEIGHVTARHTAQRFSRTVLAQGIVGLLGAVTQGTQLSGLANLATPTAVAALQSFSREHEHEADMLGIETMSRAGYDPNAMATFLAKLEQQTNLDARLAGQGGGDGFDLFATHPRTADRVQRSVNQAGGRLVRDPMLARDIYLQKIDGLLYGDDPDQGFVRGRVFAHPGLNLRFEVPDGFTLLNGERQVIAKNPQGALIQFDGGRINQGVSLERYLTDVWAKGKPLRDLRRLNINGFPAVSGTLRINQQGQQADLRLVAIETAPRTVYRFLFAGPAPLPQNLANAFTRTTNSFRRMTQQERSSLRPYRLITHNVRQGESVTSLANSLPFQKLRLDRFRVLNGLNQGQGLRPGELVKLIITN